MNSEKFYVTTPIYYVTAKPHLGSLYSTVLADVAARWNILQGKKTYFLTGTDEHGQKIADAAKKAEQTPQKFVDSFIDAYKTVWREYAIDYTYFMRTTDASHVKAVQEWITRLQKTGDIYKGFYEGWYCVSCETYVTEKEAEHAQAPACPSCGRATTVVSEETYFFRLSAYQDKLLAFYQQHPEFIVPKERAAEVISFVKTGLKDLSISRTTVKWGIPFPGDEKHTVYVWADALNNYITALGYGQEKVKEFDFWWPADLQVMGKDIVRFHAIYWPAFLMAAGLPLPKQLLVHGWILVDKQKMSKSRGNVVDPQELYTAYGADAVRYYLVRQLAINQDGEFSIADLEQKISSDLANDLGNLVNRMMLLAQKYSLSTIHSPAVWSADAQALHTACAQMRDEVHELWQSYQLHRMLAAVWKYIAQVNAYFHAQEPWKLAIHDRAAFEGVLSATCHSLRAIATVLWPIMPKKMEELLHALGTPLEVNKQVLPSLLEWNGSFTITTIAPLFAKPEPKETMDTKEITPAESYITIDDVTKVHLVVGTIVSAEHVEKSDKLLKLQVDFGARGTRQILSGIRKYYAPVDLIGKQGVFVFNLKPRPMLGMESQGMMLLAQDDQGNLRMATVDGAVTNGAQLR